MGIQKASTSMPVKRAKAYNQAIVSRSLVTPALPLNVDQLRRSGDKVLVEIDACVREKQAQDCAVPTLQRVKVRK